MTSNNQQIQYLYDKIKEYQGKNISMDNLTDKEIKNTFYFLENQSNFIQNILGIEYVFKTNANNYKDPLKCIDKNIIINMSWGEPSYFIAFIDDNILISMCETFIKRIPILKNVLLEEKGNDKPLRLYYKTIFSKDDTLLSNGPKLYISKLPLASLIFDKPPQEEDADGRTSWDIYMNRLETDWKGFGGDILEKYYMYSNLAEAIVNKQWYS